MRQRPLERIGSPVGANLAAPGRVSRTSKSKSSSKKRTKKGNAKRAGSKRSVAANVLRICTASNGEPSLRYGNVWLDDRDAPVAAARSWVDQNALRGKRLVILFGGGFGYRVSRLLELGVEKLIVFEPLRELAALRKTKLRAMYVGATVVSSLDALVEQVRKAGVMAAEAELMTTRAYFDAFGESFRRLQVRVSECFKENDVVLATIASRGVMDVEATVKNLTAAVGAKRLEAGAQPLAGKPAFLVSAGPSLDRNRHLLPEAARRGTVVAVNTSAPAVVDVGVPVDLMVVLEALPIVETIEKLEGSVKALAVDFSAHPASFRAPVEPRMVFHGYASEASPGCRLGFPVVAHAGNVAIAAMRLLAALGADPIVLIGQDCALTDGRMYGAGTGRDKWTARAEGEEMVLEYSEAFAALFEDAGLVAARRFPRVELDAWGGGKVNSIVSYAEAARAAAEVAKEEGGKRRLINATEGGAHLEGWEELPLEAVLAELPVLEERGLLDALGQADAVTEAEVRSVVETTRAGAAALAEEAARCEALRDARQNTLDASLQRFRQSTQAQPLVAVHASSSLRQARNRNETVDPLATVRRSAARVLELSDLPGTVG